MISSPLSRCAIAALAAYAMSTPITVRAQSTNAPTERWEAIDSLAGLTKNTPEVELTRIYGDYKFTLIKALHDEALRVRRASAGTLSEEEMEHFLGLIVAVSNLKDKRAIPTLLLPEVLGTSGVVMDGLAQLQPESTESVATLYWKSLDLDTKFYATIAMVSIIDAPTGNITPDEKARYQAETIFVDAVLPRVLKKDIAAPESCYLADCADSSVRVAGTRGLGRLNSPAAKALLEQLRIDSDENVRREASLALHSKTLNSP